jgi:perosamine synthetase
MAIPLSRPDITEAEIHEVLGVLRTPRLSMGPKVEEFEARIAAFQGNRHAVAVSSGTAGLHLAARALGFTDGVEVITTSFTFVATTNILLLERAVPVFVDVDPVTLNMDPATVHATIDRDYRFEDGRLINRGTGRRLAGILPVAVFGHPIDLDGFLAVGRRFDLPILHDTCEALGSEYYSRERGAWVKAGALSHVSVFAFYPNKQITTAEGGIIVTDDDGIAAYCRSGRNQGRAEGGDWLQHDIMGFNYRMDELSAALGVAQMKRIAELTAKRARVAEWYREALSSVPELTLPAAAPWARVNWFVYVVRVAPGIDRDGVMRHLARRGIPSKAYFPPVHLQPYFRRTVADHAGAFPITEDAGRRAIALPFFNDLKRDEIAEVAGALREGVKANVTVHR